MTETGGEHKRRLYGDDVIAIVFIHDGAAASTVPQHHTLQVFALGGFGIVVAGRSIDIGKWKRKQAVTLLKYLVTQLDRPVHRERLLDCLGPDVDESRGWGRLKVTMYYLRCELRANGMRDDVVKTVGKAYLLKRDAVWVDADVFERLVTEGRALQGEFPFFTDGVPGEVWSPRIGAGPVPPLSTGSGPGVWCGAPARDPALVPANSQAGK